MGIPVRTSSIAVLLDTDAGNAGDVDKVGSMSAVAATREAFPSC